MKQNLRKHKVKLLFPPFTTNVVLINEKDQFFFPKSVEHFPIDDRTCCLCYHYVGEGECVHCPLCKALGDKCDELGKPYDTFSEYYDPSEMVDWLCHLVDATRVDSQITQSKSKQKGKKEKKNVKDKAKIHSGSVCPGYR